VVLDEPNSNLDQEGELALLNCLKAAKAIGVTVFIVSHRQQILDAVDKILVLYEGEAKFFGEKNEVLAKLRGAN
jgi:ABC-type protease/lipase transport system fused ATPase/permease subunit